MWPSAVLQGPKAGMGLYEGGDTGRSGRPRCSGGARQEEGETVGRRKATRAESARSEEGTEQRPQDGHIFTAEAAETRRACRGRVQIPVGMRGRKPAHGSEAQRLQLTMAGSTCRVWMEVLRTEGTLTAAARTPPPPARCCGPSPPTHQGPSLLDFLSPGPPALPYHLDGRSAWVSGGLQGENGTAINQDVEAMQPLSGNLLAPPAIRCFAQHTLRVARCCPGRLQRCLPCKAPGPGRSGTQMVIHNPM